MRVRFLRLSYFIWIIVPILIYGAYLAFGLPHMRWSYSWQNDGQGYDPFVERYYTRCTYIGPYGSFTIYPDNGKCVWFRFYKQQGDA